MQKLLLIAAALLLSAPAQAYEKGHKWDIRTHLAQDKSHPLFYADGAYSTPFKTAETPQARCAAQGKTYYERTSGSSFFGIPVSKQVVWSGCLSDAEAAMAGAGTTTYSQPYRPPTPAYQPPRTCYGTATGYGTYTGTCY